MNQAKQIIYIVLLATFLSANGKICIPCLVSLFQHQCESCTQACNETHKHCHCFCHHDDDEENKMAAECPHHFCPDPISHSRLVPINLVSPAQSEKTGVADFGVSAVLVKDFKIPIVGKSWLSSGGKVRGPPIFIEYQQLLI